MHSENPQPVPLSDEPVPEGSLFDDLTLPDPVRDGIRTAGFVRCTPIQDRVLPLSLTGRDVAGQAQTGTGKTAAFLITLFTRLLESGRTAKPAQPRALVIAPTRELVVQIAQDAELLGQHTPFRIHVVYGGVDYEKQRAALADPIDLLIGTPGRLIDYFKQRAYGLKRIEGLVIDEADRMFDMGFIRDVRYLLRRLPPFNERQSMLFSATLSWQVMELAYEHMNEPERIAVHPERVTADKVVQRLYHVGNDEKVPLLVGILKREAGERVLIFTNMKRTASDLEEILAANGFRAAAISGDLPQRKRLQVLRDFKEGALPILIATDVASRGLHIEGVSHVVNYDLPQDAEDYVHRIGRTARAGASGHAVSLACEDFVTGLEAIEELIGFKIPYEHADESLLERDVVRPKRRRRSYGGDGRRGGPRDGRRGAPRSGRPPRRSR